MEVLVKGEGDVKVMVKSEGDGETDSEGWR